MKVAISYGFGEGQWHGKRIRRSLHQAGLTVTKDLHEADVILAHSGGCYRLPRKSRANIIILVGLPYWPGKHPIRSLWQKLRTDIKNWRWVGKSLIEMMYVVIKPLRWYRMWRGWRPLDLPPTTENRTVALVRNRHDPLLHPTDAAALATDKGWDFNLFSGPHDDLWSNPEPYVKLIKRKLEEID